MAFWLGVIALVLAAIIIPMGLKQGRTLIPIFDKEPMLRDAAHVPGSPFFWLGGTWYLGLHYAAMLTVIYLTPAHMLEREQATFPCTKAEFMQHFSQGEARRAVVFSALMFTFLVLIVLVYLLMPADAR